MHEYLRDCIVRLADYWEKHPSALAFAMNGSGGRGHDDRWSDGDVVLVVTDESYRSVCGEMRRLLRRYCGEIFMWLPEGETERCVNYAFLFEKDGEQFLMDHAVFCESLMSETPAYEAGLIYFDRSGALSGANRRFADSGHDFTAQTLSNIIDTYLTYTYLNGKYYRRADVAKLLYIQNTLQSLHIRLFQALYPDKRFTGWWCRDIEYLSDEHKSVVLMYAAPAEPAILSNLVIRELELFGAHARAACRAFAIPYPEEAEAFVYRQLTDAGLRR